MGGAALPRKPLVGTGLGRGLMGWEFTGTSVGTWARIEESCCGVMTFKSERYSSSLIIISQGELHYSLSGKTYVTNTANCSVDHGLLLRADHLRESVSLVCSCSFRDIRGFEGFKFIQGDGLIDRLEGLARLMDNKVCMQIRQKK